MNARDKLRRVFCEAVHKRSGDPRASVNADDADWQAGYFTGTLTDTDFELYDDNHPITVEWRLRGSRSKPDPRFSNWKAGYWAGRYARL